MIVTQALKKANMLAAMLVMASFAGVAQAAECGDGCDDHSKREPSEADLFIVEVPNALDPAFIYDIPDSGKIKVSVGEGCHDAGLGLGNATRIYGYYAEDQPGLKGIPTWPGKTFQVRKSKPIQVTWVNNIEPNATHPYIITGPDNTDVPQWNDTSEDGGIGPDPYYDAINGYGDYSDIPVIDETLHWAYSLSDLKTNPPLDKATLGANGVPIVTHLHGGHSDDIYDGNPEFFFNHNLSVLGPEYVTNEYTYDNNFEATAIWYHDHTLGITRVNVYAGMAGFYILRDPFDTGNNTGSGGGKSTLPVFPYEAALAIQDRMFKTCGEFLYPAFPGDEAHYGFIAGEGVDLPPKFGDGGPTALAEFFGDHMVVNGKVWPKMEVEPRNYRLRLLNGCDSRFLVIEFVAVDAGATEFDGDADPLPFHVIGSDQGFRKQDKVGLNITATKLVMGPGERFDVIIDFQGLNGTRVIMKNTGGDEPFGGLPGEGEELPQLFDYTDRIMAFDVGTQDTQDDFEINDFLSTLEQKGHPPIQGMVKRIRKVALFEGKDEYGRLQPVLGTVEPSTNYKGETIEWPDDSANCADPCLGLCVTADCHDPSDCHGKNCSGCPYTCANLTGPVQGTVGWHTDPSSENPKQNDVEEWELWNLSGDAHPVHLHLVDFEVISRRTITVNPESLLTGQPLVQHNGLLGEGFFAQACNATECLSDPLDLEFYYDIGYPKDVVIALPGQVTTIKAKFHKKGRYVWHCHILSHEDHEMMRVMYVGDETATQRHLRGESQNVEDNEGGDSNEGEESS